MKLIVWKGRLRIISAKYWCLENSLFQCSSVQLTGPRILCSKTRLGVVRLGASNASSASARDTKCVMAQKIGSSTSEKKISFCECPLV